MTWAATSITLAEDAKLSGRHAKHDGTAINTRSSSLVLSRPCQGWGDPPGYLQQQCRPAQNNMLQLNLKPSVLYFGWQIMTFCPIPQQPHSTSSKSSRVLHSNCQHTFAVTGKLPCLSCSESSSWLSCSSFLLSAYISGNR